MLHTLTQHVFNTRALGACVATLALTGPTLTAGAAPGHTNVIVSGGVRVVDRCAPAPACRPVVIQPVVRCDDFAQREYQRGFNRGEAFGSNAGYRDALSGDRFCPESRDELCDNSRFYRDGYIAAFGNAYRCGFEKGRADRARAAASHCDDHHGSFQFSVWGSHR